MYINGKPVYTNENILIHPPHELGHVLGSYHKGSPKHVEDAIQAAMAAKDGWGAMPWEERAAIFLKAADLLSGPFRARMNAATMLCQSKNVFQAEIDCVAELADFYRFNVQFMTDIYSGQPESAPGIWNRLEYRPLEGFIFALTPFNFTSIAAILTIIGYSINNSIVIFDRIRENTDNIHNNITITIVNKSINDSLSRTIMTFLTTFAACLSLMIFGGENLKSFSAVITFGVAFGTYSSIFISTNLLPYFNKKE